MKITPAQEAKWRKAVKERDGYCCRRCRRYDPGVHAHHIAGRKQRPDLRLSVDNGVSLCTACHNWVHANPEAARAEGLMGGESYELAMSRQRDSVTSHQPKEDPNADA